MKNSSTKKHVLGLLIVVFAIIFCVSAYMLIDYYVKGHKAESDFDKTRDVISQSETDNYASMKEALNKLYEQNNDFVGWLNVFNTGIDYPVMQTRDDAEYYLHRDFNKDYSLPGTLFVADITDLEKPSDVTIIYGHHMKNGTMFGPLMKYEKKKYYEKHRFLRFDTLQERRCYEITNVFKISIDEEFKYYSYADFKDETEYDYFIDEINKHAIYNTGVTSEYGDEFIMLSTCEYSQKDGRLVVLAKRVPESDVIK